MKTFSALCSLFVCFVLFVESNRSTAADPELFIVNEDNSHYFGSRKTEEMDIPHLEAFVDQYAGGKVTHLFLCPNAMRASFRSKTREAIWDPVPGVAEEVLHEKWKTQSPKHWAPHAKLLYDKGIDPYEIWIRRCREKNISPWLSMRMNDLHDVNDPLNFQHSEFWRSNPQFRLVPGHTGGGWSSYALDYAHPEVREYQLAFVRELLERYDPDGIELDWLRFQYNLKEKNGRCDEDAHFIDDFVRNVRQLVDEWSKKRGREIKLGVRVPSNPDASDARGLKAVHWAKEAWIDWIVASTDWGVTDFDIRFDHWKERLGPEAAERVILLGGAERLTSAYPGAKNVVYDVPALYGFADNARFRGADGVYLFNWFDGGAGTPPESSYRRLLDGGFSCDFLVEQERRYPLCFRNIAPAGLPNAAQLPRETDKPVTVRILAGKAVQPGKAVLVLGFEKRDGLDAAAFSLSCNGKSLDAPEEEKGLTRLGSAPARALRFSCPSGDVRAGDNDIVLTQTKGEKQRLVWVELRVLP